MNFAKNMRKIFLPFPLTDTTSECVLLSEMRSTLQEEQRIILTRKDKGSLPFFSVTEAKKEQQLLVYVRQPLAITQTISFMKNPHGIVHKNFSEFIIVSLRERWEIYKTP